MVGYLPFRDPFGLEIIVLAEGVVALGRLGLGVRLPLAQIHRFQLRVQVPVEGGEAILVEEVGQFVRVGRV